MIELKPKVNVQAPVVRARPCMPEETETRVELTGTFKEILMSKSMKLSLFLVGIVYLQVRDSYVSDSYSEDGRSVFCCSTARELGIAMAYASASIILCGRDD